MTPNVSGDLFWELAGHAARQGWQPIPADERCRPTCNGVFVEDRNWWAMYYTGRPTASNSAADMAAREQIIRAAAYRIDGFRRAPAHEVSPSPINRERGPCGRPSRRAGRDRVRPAS